MADATPSRTHLEWADGVIQDLALTSSLCTRATGLTEALAGCLAKWDAQYEEMFKAFDPLERVKLDTLAQEVDELRAVLAAVLLNRPLNVTMGARHQEVWNKAVERAITALDDLHRIPSWLERRVTGLQRFARLLAHLTDPAKHPQNGGGRYCSHCGVSMDTPHRVGSDCPVGMAQEVLTEWDSSATLRPRKEPEDGNA